MSEILRQMGHGGALTASNSNSAHLGKSSDFYWARWTITLLLTRTYFSNKRCCFTVLLGLVCLCCVIYSLNCMSCCSHWFTSCRKEHNMLLALNIVINRAVCGESHQTPFKNHWILWIIAYKLSNTVFVNSAFCFSAFKKFRTKRCLLAYKAEIRSPAMCRCMLIQQCDATWVWQKEEQKRLRPIYL